MSADLATLVKQWRVSRSPRLADAIERLGRADDSDGVGAQLAALNKGKSVDHFVAAVKAATKLDDPRLTVVVIQWLNTARVPGSSAAKSWSQLFKKLEALRDARAITPLRAVAAAAPPFLGAKHTEWIQQEADATADILEELVTKLKKPTAAEKKALTALEATLTVPAADWFARKRVGPTSSTLELLQRVWAAPDDDALKQVVADGLLELDEPWGELINLQCTGTPAAQTRAADLIKRIGATVCGPIAKIAGVPQRVYANGFLVSCDADASMKPRRDWDDALAAPHWATVRRIGFCTATPKWFVPALLATPHARRFLEIAICHYNDPYIILKRTTVDAPWLVTGKVPRTGVGWFKTFTDVAKALPALERAHLQIGDIPAAAELRTALAEAEAKSSPAAKKQPKQ